MNEEREEVDRERWDGRMNWCVFQSDLVSDRCSPVVWNMSADHTHLNIYSVVFIKQENHRMKILFVVKCAQASATISLRLFRLTNLL